MTPSLCIPLSGHEGTLLPGNPIVGNVIVCWSGVSGKKAPSMVFYSWLSRENMVSVLWLCIVCSSRFAPLVTVFKQDPYLSLSETLDRDLPKGNLAPIRQRRTAHHARSEFLRSLYCPLSHTERRQFSKDMPVVADLDQRKGFGFLGLDLDGEAVGGLVFEWVE